jgi:hypothetical protein
MVTTVLGASIDVLRKAYTSTTERLLPVNGGRAMARNAVSDIKGEYDYRITYKSIGYSV